MKSEEEQAQAVAEIRAAHKGALDIIAWEADCEKAVNVKTVLTMMGKLLEIVDSQVQKYENLLAAHNVLGIIFDELKADREAQVVKIAEQAKEIERLTKERDEARTHARIRDYSRALCEPEKDSKEAAK